MNTETRDWLTDLAVGGLGGGLVGAIVAVNFVIYVGIEDGYEASLRDVFDQSVWAGIVTVLILVAGPIVGLIAARRVRRRRASTQ